MKALKILLGKAAKTISAIGPAPAPDVIYLHDRSANSRAGNHTATNSAAPGATPLPRNYRGRLAILLAAITVPAVAAPGDFGALAGSAPTEAEMVNARLTQQLSDNPAMPFERPGMSFPGSAFFFLAPPDAGDTGALVALPTTDALDSGAEAGRRLGEVIDAGPAARPFFGPAGTSHLRASQCLAQAVWYEAASENEAGQRAVAQVVLNRVANTAWPNSICGVVYEGSQRSTGCQFSFTCDGSLARRAAGASWARAQRIADEALSGSVYEPIGRATHYHTLWVNPYWASSLDHVGTIGAHRFYRSRGAAGAASAFASRYAGTEPSVSGRMTPSPPGAGGYAMDGDMPDLPAANPALGAADMGRTAAFRPAGGDGGSSAENRSGNRAPFAPAPVLADPALSSAGQVRDDYARAGQWKSDEARAAYRAEREAAQSTPGQ